MLKLRHGLYQVRIKSDFIYKVWNIKFLSIYDYIVILQYWRGARKILLTHSCNFLEIYIPAIHGKIIIGSVVYIAIKSVILINKLQSESIL